MRCTTLYALTRINQPGMHSYLAKAPKVKASIMSRPLGIVSRGGQITFPKESQKSAT